MFIHFLCLCPVRLVIMLNFNISKVAYWPLLPRFQLKILLNSADAIEEKRAN